jgi:hypothetical protein
MGLECRRCHRCREKNSTAPSSSSAATSGINDLADDLNFSSAALISFRLELSGPSGPKNRPRIVFSCRDSHDKPNRPPLIVALIQSPMQSVPSLDQLNQSS